MGRESPALDAAGNPHISYACQIAEPFYRLRYARWIGSAWPIETVDGGQVVGPYNSLDLDAGGNPHISYDDGGAREPLCPQIARPCVLSYRPKCRL